MLAIISALPQEAHELRQALSEVREVPWAGGAVTQGMLYGRRVVLASCGVGKVLAAMTTQHVVETFSPTQVLFVGLAGSLHSGISRGDIVLGREVLQHDVDARDFGWERGQIPYTTIKVLAGDPQLLARAMTYQPPHHRIHAGRILTGDQFIIRRTDGRWTYLTEELRGDAAEMEGAAVAVVCHLHKIPCLVVRTISDGGDENAAADFMSFLHEASRNVCELLRVMLSR